jgi:hypothetical protein
MKVDDCSFTFEELSASVLPAHMRRLRESLASPWEASIFAERGSGPEAIARQLGRDGDFKGCYVLSEGGQPIYVGISRSVLARVRQHMTGTTHFSASLPYLMAQRGVPVRGSRDEAMQDQDFRAAFDSAQRRLQTCTVATVQIENPIELYLFEVYTAMALGTGEWNTFETH